MTENKSRVCCFYDYADKCDCAEDDRCGCSYPNNANCPLECVKPHAAAETQPDTLQPNTVCFCSPKDCDCRGVQQRTEN